jgi:integrase
LEGLDIPKIRFHDMRHTAATILLQQETHPLLVLQRDFDSGSLSDYQPG